MALGQTNITTTLIRNILMAGSNKVSELCTHININKWSKHKPVRGSFPLASNGYYGIDIANDWTYLRPRGIVYNEPYRMGDFRGYHHNAIPPFRLSLYPSGTLGSDTVNVSLTCQADDISVEDLVLEGYYLGVCIVQGGSITTYYSAALPLSDRETEPDSLTVHIPDLVNGNYSWSAFISETQSIAGAEPYGVINLPVFQGYVISGSFVVSLQNPVATFINNVSGITVGGNYVRDEDHIHFVALNTGASREVSFTASLNGGTPVACGTAYITEGDSETGLPETTGIIAGIPAAGYGDSLEIVVYQ